MAGSFFTTGGTVRSDSPGYVERSADRELFSALSAEEFCYVLDSRQKGKSSLVSRALGRLEAAGIATATIDLQRFGTNLDAERWYAGMLNAVAEGVVRSTGQDLRSAIFAYWASQQRFGPLERWMGALQSVVLHALGAKRLAVFIDEIDFVRSLPFDTDEFFAGIRECYNRRAEDPGLSRLSFCLLGVATPSELIRDVRITPFNVGRRIELTDFTLSESMAFAAGLVEAGRTPAEADRLVRRIHHWTNGHPYLTQRLGAAIAADPSVSGAADVDRLVERTFFAQKSREEEPNLRDVSRRVLETAIEGLTPEESRARILDLFRQVRDNRKVRDDETDPVASVLKLAGLTTVLGGYLLVRNKVYFRVFDRSWIEAGMPDAELIRQRIAVRRATLRTAAVAGAVILAIGSLAAYSGRLAQLRQSALRQAHQETRNAELARADEARANARSQAALRQTNVALAAAKAAETSEAKALAKEAVSAAAAKRESNNAKSQTRIAEGQRRQKEAQVLIARAAQAAAKGEAATANRLAYDADMMLLQNAYERRDIANAAELLAETGKSPCRGFEWGYWDRLLNSQIAEFPAAPAPELSAWSPDGNRLIVTSTDASRVQIRDAGDGSVLIERAFGPATLMPYAGNSTSRRSISRVVKCVGYEGSKPFAIVLTHCREVESSRDTHRNHSWVNTADDYAIEDLSRGERGLTLRCQGPTPSEWRATRDGRGILAFSPIGDSDRVHFWRTADGRALPPLRDLPTDTAFAELSPDGSLLVHDGNLGLQVYSTATGRVAWSKTGEHLLDSHCFSPDGSRLLAYGKLMHVVNSATGEVTAWHEVPKAATFTPTGLRIAMEVTSVDGVGVANGYGCDVWDPKAEPGLGIGTEAHPGLANAPSGPNATTAGVFGLVRDKIAVAPDGARVALFSRGLASVRILDLTSGQLLADVEANDWVGFSPTGARLLARREEGLGLFDSGSNRYELAVPGLELSGSAVFTRGGGEITAAGSEGLQRWRTAEASLIASEKGPGGKSFYLSPTGSILLAKEREHLRAVRVPDGRALWTIDMGDKEGRYDAQDCCAFSPNGLLVALRHIDVGFSGVASVRGEPNRTATFYSPNPATLSILQANTGAVVAEIPNQTSSGTFSPAGDKILVGLEVYGARTGRRLYGLNSPIKADGVAFSPDGATIVANSLSGGLVVFSAETGKLISTAKFEERVTNAELLPADCDPSLSPDGARVFVESKNDSGVATYYVYNRRSGTSTELKGGPGVVSDASFAPNGMRLMTTDFIRDKGNHDSTLRIWDVESGAQLLTIRDAQRAIWSFGRSPRAILIGNNSRVEFFGRSDGPTPRSGTEWLEREAEVDRMNGAPGVAAACLATLIERDPGSVSLRAKRLQACLAALGKSTGLQTGNWQEWVADDAARVDAIELRRLSYFDGDLLFHAFIAGSFKIPPGPTRDRLRSLFTELVRSQPDRALHEAGPDEALQSAVLVNDLGLAAKILSSTQDRFGAKANSEISSGGPMNSWVSFWQESALVSAKLRDAAKWRSITEHIQAFANKSGDIRWWFWARNEACFAPDPVNRGTILAAVGSTFDDGLSAWAASGPGALLYRMGRFEDSCAALRRSIDLYGSERKETGGLIGDSCHINETYYAMALARTGQHAEAEKVLAETDAWVKGNLCNQPWYTQLELEMLLDEAHALIQKH